MAVLSKMVIEQIASKMTDKSKKYVEQLKKQYEQIATDYYESSIPDVIKKAFKDHCEYFDLAGSVKFNGHGFNHETVSMSKRLVSNGGNYYATIKLTSDMANKLQNAKRKYEKAKDEFKTLFDETEGALLALKTHKNIRENLPQAAPYLPPPMSNALVVSFDSLQKRLNKQPDLKEQSVSVK